MKIFIDSAEQQPFTFQGIKADADEDYRTFIVTTEWRSLGRYPHSLGDYSVEGCEKECHVERKSLTDCQGTLLGFNDGRRERFKSELSNLERIPTSLVVVEATFLTVVDTPCEFSQKPPGVTAKILHRSILAMMQDFKVPWLFCDSRRHAEVATFRFLRRYWEKRAREKKQFERLMRRV